MTSALSLLGQQLLLASEWSVLGPGLALSCGLPSPHSLPSSYLLLLFWGSLKLLAGPDWSLLPRALLPPHDFLRCPDSLR